MRDEQASNAASEDCRPYVYETLYCKSLHFSALEVQSRMLKREPDKLALDYTRTMMGFLLFKPRPLHIAMIGLGGGSLAKFCYRELPHARIDVVEINPHVVALREEFQVPPDDERFRVHLEDGAHFVERSNRCLDVLLVDGYGLSGVPASLSSQAFYTQCRRALRDDALMVSNLHGVDTDTHIARIRRSFTGTVFTVDETTCANQIVFAFASTGVEPMAVSDDTALARLGPAVAPLKRNFDNIAAAMRMRSSH
jgi:spermidine synthase